MEYKVLGKPWYLFKVPNNKEGIEYINNFKHNVLNTNTYKIKLRYSTLSYDKMLKDLKNIHNVIKEKRYCDTMGTYPKKWSKYIRVYLLEK